MFELVEAIAIDADGHAVRGRARVPAMPWLDDHFPDAPIAPATLLVELAAQIAGPLAEARAPGRGAVLAMIRHAVFRAPVAVPAELAIDAQVIRTDSDTISCRAEIAGVATVELVFALIAIDPDSAAWRARQARVQAWQEAW